MGQTKAVNQKTQLETPFHEFYIVKVFNCTCYEVRLLQILIQLLPSSVNR